MENWLYPLLSVMAVSLISLIGVFAVWFSTLFGQRLLTFLVSFSAGALLGDVFIHLLPELVEEGNFEFRTSIYILLTMVLFFVFEKYLHWHHHHDEDPSEKHAHPLVFSNIVGDGLHNLIDGLIIGGAYVLDVKLGLATTLAVALHEIPQEIGDFGVLVYGGLSKAKALMYNFGSALTAIAGTIIALLLGENQALVPILAALGIGSFLYIATADLIPAIHKEKDQPIGQLLSFALGIGIMFLLLLLE